MAQMHLNAAANLNAPWTREQLQRLNDLSVRCSFCKRTPPERATALQACAHLYCEECLGHIADPSALLGMSLECVICFVASEFASAEFMDPVDRQQMIMVATELDDDGGSMFAGAAPLLYIPQALPPPRRLSNGELAEQLALLAPSLCSDRRVPVREQCTADARNYLALCMDMLIEHMGLRERRGVLLMHTQQLRDVWSWHYGELMQFENSVACVRMLRLGMPWMDWAHRVRRLFGQLTVSFLARAIYCLQLYHLSLTGVATEPCIYASCSREKYCLSQYAEAIRAPITSTVDVATTARHLLPELFVLERLRTVQYSGHSMTTMCVPMGTLCSQPHLARVCASCAVKRFAPNNRISCKESRTGSYWMLYSDLPLLGVDTFYVYSDTQCVVDNNLIFTGARMRRLSTVRARDTGASV
jgi:hypothetical protein